MHAPHPSSGALRAALFWLLPLAVLLAAAPAMRAQTGPLPAPVGYVNDFAGVLPTESRARIEDLAQRLNAATRGDMVVVTLPDLGGRPVEEVSLRLGREWKIGANSAVGDSARNAGVVILVVPKETSADGRGYCRIETGQGTEGFITDATAGAICRSVTDRFIARDYAGAIESLAASVADRYAAAFGVGLDGAPRPQQRNRGRPAGDGVQILILILVFIVLPMIFSRGGRRRGCVGCIPIPIGGGGFGGGSSGGWGGGGGFGGGGGGGFGGFGGGGGFSGGGGGSNW